VHVQCFGSVDFNDRLSVVAEAVKQAEFLAIDAEFSGLFVLLHVLLAQLETGIACVFVFVCVCPSSN